MYKFWEKLSQREIKSRIFDALGKNDSHLALGIPGSALDKKVFSKDHFILKDAPYISTLVQNPNHIGCHTLGKSESYFKGTQAIEKELLEICSVDILKGEPLQQDGYVASGGTEANMQAIWIYRNYFIDKFAAKREEICIFCSEDSHYSINKAANIFVLDIFKVPVDKSSREVSVEMIRSTALDAIEKGKKHFIVICNMMSTMFGSVDNVDNYVNALSQLDCEFKIHIDAAFGGFYYPFTEEQSALTFKNPYISSFTLDAHKMAQAPFGTGIFLIRKGYMKYTNTQQASYVEGEDYTLIGSRSGANAIAVWMILMKNGPFGWHEKISTLQKRTDWMCAQLLKRGVQFYRNPKSNIIAISSKCIEPKIAGTFGLVPDNHSDPKWYKVVVMEHVTIEKLIPLVNMIKKNKTIAQ